MKIDLSQMSVKLLNFEPAISQRTLAFHMKHYKTYLSNLENLVTGTKFENIDLQTIIKVAEGPVYNNAAEVWNHQFYFDCLGPNNNKIPGSPVIDVINENFGSFDIFKDSFVKSAISLFGAGWIWLVLNPRGGMEIIQEGNAGNPLRRGLKPMLACDLWEHAYYLDYQNRRAEYLNAFWSLINWEIIEKRFLEARN